MSQKISLVIRSNWRHSLQQPPHLSRGRLHTTSSKSNRFGSRFPYPTHRNPTPHQIFHLPRNASESDIKARYIDLVQVYHPDRADADISSEIAHERFQAITTAYDALRGKKLLNSDTGSSNSAHINIQSTAAWRTLRKKQQELYSSGAVDDTWKDRLIIAGVVLTILFVVTHTFNLRREALVDAMDRSRQISSHQGQQKYVDESRLSSSDSSAK